MREACSRALREAVPGQLRWTGCAAP